MHFFHLEIFQLFPSCILIACTTKVFGDGEENAVSALPLFFSLVRSQKKKRKFLLSQEIVGDLWEMQQWKFTTFLVCQTILSQIEGKIASVFHATTPPMSACAAEVNGLFVALPLSQQKGSDCPRLRVETGLKKFSR